MPSVEGGRRKEPKPRAALGLRKVRGPRSLIKSATMRLRQLQERPSPENNRLKSGEDLAVPNRGRSALSVAVRAWNAEKPLAVKPRRSRDLCRLPGPQNARPDRLLKSAPEHLKTATPAKANRPNGAPRAIGPATAKPGRNGLCEKTKNNGSPKVVAMSAAGGMIDVAVVVPENLQLQDRRRAQGARSWGN
jgi:hypothetical protein